jgi:hypothetical protein
VIETTCQRRNHLPAYAQSSPSRWFGGHRLTANRFKASHKLLTTSLAQLTTGKFFVTLLMKHLMS